MISDGGDGGDGGDAGDGGDGGDGGEFIRLNLPGMKKMSPPTVGANDRRIHSPLFAHRSCTTDRRRPRCGPNVGITPVSPDVVEYTQV
jgi:hypothetical protein